MMIVYRSTYICEDMSKMSCAIHPSFDFSAFVGKVKVCSLVDLLNNTHALILDLYKSYHLPPTPCLFNSDNFFF